MSDAWLIVALVSAATIVLKGAGPVLLGGRTAPAPLLRVLGLLAPALLAALVVTNTFAGDRRLVLDARAAGVAVAIVAVALRAPVLVVVVAAAATAAVLRALGS